MFNDVKNLYRLFYVADFRLFRDNQVDVDVGVDEVAVSAALDGPFDPHEAVFLQSTGHPAQSVHQATFVTLYIADVPNAKTLLLSLTLWDTVPWAIQ